MLEIAPLNPIIFYGTLPYDFEHSWPKCYFQKFETNDSTRIQILSDSEVSVIAKRLGSNETIHSFPVAAIPMAVEGFTFNVYESALNWSDVGEGEYYLEVENNDSALTSAPISIMDQFEGTLLLRYRNSENNFSVLFDTNIIFDLRVEGTIQNFSPKADDEIYNDEKRNATKLSSIPYQTFTLFIGGSAGLPDWMTDKVNRIMSCDMIRIGGRRKDGVDIIPDWFEKVEGAEWEVKREVEYPFSGLEIEIMPTNNLFLQRLKFEDNSDDDMANTVLLRRAENRMEQSANFSVSGIFRDMSVLIYIRIKRRGVAFTFNVGVTPGGDEIGTFTVAESVMTFQVRHPFDAPTTLYLTGVTGDNDFTFIYEQLDEVGGGEGGVIPPNPESLGIGAVILYEQPTVQFEQDFDLVTGLGRTGTAWQGWAICNGNNGTQEIGGKVAVGWKKDDPKFGQISDTGGLESVQLSPAQQGRIEMQVLADHSQGSQSVRQIKGIRIKGEGASSWEGTANVQGQTYGTWSDSIFSSLGQASAPHENMPPYIVLAYVKKIA